jgi:hypothetical protein
VGQIVERTESSSFLKKRTKKLLLVARSCRAHHVETVVSATDKSSLVLFFKKELLPVLTFATKESVP